MAERLDAAKEVKSEQGTSKMMQMLDWAYERAVNGLPLLSSAVEQAEGYVKRYPGDPGRQADALIRWQVTKAASSGFVTGLGGFITLPVTMPANIASVLYIQLKMIASIAHIYGHDVRDDRVRTMAYVCLVGDVAKEVLKNLGIKMGEKIAIGVIKNVSWDIVREVNKKVAFRLLTKFGEKGLINLNKLVPIVGGLISASFDAVSTTAVGKTAKKFFAE